MGAFTYYVIRRRGKSGVSKILMHDYGGLLGEEEGVGLLIT